jgi:5-methylcytosine-specific restriction enzyme A
MPYINRPKKQRDYYYGSDSKRTERQKIYNNPRWKRLRAWKLVLNPLCEICLERGVNTPAVEVHHKVSFMTTDDPIDRYNLAFDIDNMQSVCRHCHDVLHGNTKE